MATERAYFFDAVEENGRWDRTYASSDFAQLFNAIYTNGIVPAYKQGLMVSTGTTGLKPTVVVSAGAAVIDGRVYVLEDSSNAGITKELSALTGSAARIDRIVVELNVTDRTLAVKILEGTPAADPVAPEISRTKNLYHLVLAEVCVRPGASTIGENDLTDCRADLTLCGWCGVRLKSADLSAITQAWYNSLRSVYDPDAPVSGSSETSSQAVLRLIAMVEGLNTDFSIVQDTVAQVEANQQTALSEITDTITSTSSAAGQIRKIYGESAEHPWTAEQVLSVGTFISQADLETLGCNGSNDLLVVLLRRDYHQDSPNLMVVVPKGGCVVAYDFDTVANAQWTREIRWNTSQYTVKFHDQSVAGKTRKNVTRTFGPGLFFSWGMKGYKESAAGNYLEDWKASDGQGYIGKDFTTAQVTTANANAAKKNVSYNCRMIPYAILAITGLGAGERPIQGTVPDTSGADE